MNQLTAEGLALIKIFEGCKLQAYLDGGGVPTIGYGHIENVKIGDICSQSEADNWLLKDIAQKAEIPLITFLDGIKLTNNQYSALVSLVFNCGTAPLQGHLGHYLIAGDFTNIALEFSKWNHINGQISQGLTKRRKIEQQLFQQPIGEQYVFSNRN